MSRSWWPSSDSWHPVVEPQLLTQSFIILFWKLLGRKRRKTFLKKKSNIWWFLYQNIFCSWIISICWFGFGFIVITLYMKSKVSGRLSVTPICACWTSHSRCIPVCCCNELYTSWKAFHDNLERGCGDLYSFNYKRITEVRYADNVGCSRCSSLCQRCSVGLRSGLCAKHSRSSTPPLACYVVMDLALCIVMWEQFGLGLIPIKGES